MQRRENQGKKDTMVNVPRSILFKSLKGAIKSGEEESISELTDILYASMLYHGDYNQRIEENRLKIENQHNDIMHAIESMKEGFRQVDKRFEQVDKRFEQVDKRFDELIHQMDKRFEQIDKRFTFQTWLVGIGFISINTLVVLLKLFA